MNPFVGCPPAMLPCLDQDGELRSDSSDLSRQMNALRLGGAPLRWLNINDRETEVLVIAVIAPITAAVQT